jgi:hypothetical protein
MEATLQYAVLAFIAKILSRVSRAAVQKAVRLLSDSIAGDHRNPA